MVYSISEMAEIAGVSTRTLRYYDTVDLLKPSSVNDAGYRFYDEACVKQLQLILFYKVMGFPLNRIRELMDSGSSRLALLKGQCQELLAKQQRLEGLIQLVGRTIEAEKGGKNMSDEAKFEGLKESMIQHNEEKYGKEIREKYGDDAVDFSYKAVRNMSEEDHAAMNRLAEDIIEKLIEAKAMEDHTGPLAKQVYEMHKEWISFYWQAYNPKHHKGLADMYVADDRFRDYYDQHGEGLATWLRDIIHHFA